MYKFSFWYSEQLFLITFCIWMNIKGNCRSTQTHFFVTLHPIHSKGYYKYLYIYSVHIGIKCYNCTIYSLMRNFGTICERKNLKLKKNVLIFCTYPFSTILKIFFIQSFAIGCILRVAAVYLKHIFCLFAHSV